MPKKENRELFTLRLPPRVIARIKALALKMGVFQCDVVEQAIEALKKEEKSS